MIDSSKYKLLHFIDSHRIHVLMISILILVFVPPFVQEIPNFINHFMNFDFLIIVTASFLIVRKHTLSRYVGFVTFIMIVIDSFIESDVLNYLGQLGISYLIVHAFFKVLKEAMSLKGETKNLILVSITGYLIIGLISGFLAAGLEFIYPNSFYHSNGMALELYNYIYYGFVTTTTLGYGDIIPNTEKAQALALMMVISGQLFLSIIIAINIAKFMQKKNG